MLKINYIIQTTVQSSAFFFINPHDLNLIVKEKARKVKINVIYEKSNFYSQVKVKLSYTKQCHAR